MASPGDFNVLLITSDQHNAKMTGYDGYPDIRTPGMDRLSREGLTLNRAYCAYPVCAPTRQSIYTGLYPQEHGQIQNDYVFQKGNVTIGDAFRKAGYLTAIIGKTHDNNPLYDLGMDVCGKEVGSFYSAHPDPDDDALARACPDKRFISQVIDDPRDIHDRTVYRRTEEFLREHRDEKFFLHMSMLHPHWPFSAPEEYYYMYDPDRIYFPPLGGRELDGDPFVYRNAYLRQRWDELPEKLHRAFRARYMGMISWMDSWIGRVLDLLDELHLTENTLVMYLSDHGDMAGEKGLWFKMLLYDGAARTPAVMRMPGVLKPGSRSDTLFNHVDLMPTLLGLTGHADASPTGISGRDLSAALKDGAEGPAYTFTVSKIREDGYVNEYMARSHRWKLIAHNQPDTPEQERYVLFDMDNDPGETVNLAHDKACASVLHEHLSAAADFLASRRPYRGEYVRLPGHFGGFTKPRE